MPNPIVVVEEESKIVDGKESKFDVKTLAFFESTKQMIMIVTAQDIRTADSVFKLLRWCIGNSHLDGGKNKLKFEIRKSFFSTDKLLIDGDLIEALNHLKENCISLSTYNKALKVAKLSSQLPLSEEKKEPHQNVGKKLKLL